MPLHTTAASPNSITPSISYLQSLLNIFLKYTISFTCFNIFPIILTLNSVISSFLSNTKTFVLFVFRLRPLFSHPSFRVVTNACKSYSDDATSTASCVQQPTHIQVTYFHSHITLFHSLETAIQIPIEQPS